MPPWERLTEEDYREIGRTVDRELRRIIARKQAAAAERRRRQQQPSGEEQQEPKAESHD